MLDIATTIMRKNIKLFLMCGSWNSCRKVKYIWSVDFNIISTIMQFGNDLFLFIFPVTWTHIQSQPFRPTRYVLKSFRYLDVRNRVRNWNKEKNFIFVGTKLQLFQLEIPIFLYEIMCQSTLINSFSFLVCEFIRVTSSNDAKLLF